MKRKDWPEGNLPQRTVWGSKSMEKTLKLSKIARKQGFRDVWQYRWKYGMYVCAVDCTPEQADAIEQEAKHANETRS